MSSNIIINSSNYVKGSGNRFVYNLTTRPDLTGYYVSLVEATMYNCTFNITATFGNNQFYLSFPSNSGTLYATNNGTPSSQQTPVIIQDGYYSIQDLSAYIDNICQLNGIYCTSNTSANTNVYFIDLVENPTQYAVNINLFQLSTNSDYSLPSNSRLQLNGGYLSITFMNGLGAIVGFPDNVAITGTTTTPTPQPIISPYQGLTFTSPLSPNVNVIDSYVMGLNIVNNQLNVDKSIFYSIPLVTGIGGLLAVSPKNDISQKCNSQSYDSIVVTFYDQNLRPLNLLDSQISIILSLTLPTQPSKQ